MWVIARKRAEAGNADLEERIKEKKVMFHKGVQIQVSWDITCQFLWGKVSLINKSTNNGRQISTAGPHFAFQMSCADKTPYLKVVGLLIEQPAITKNDITQQCSPKGNEPLKQLGNEMLSCSCQDGSSQCSCSNFANAPYDRISITMSWLYCLIIF